MIDKSRDKNKTQRGSGGAGSLQSQRADLRVNLWAKKPNLVIAVASPTPITMLPSLQTWTEAYSGSITLLNVPVFCKSMPDLAEAKPCHSSLDER